MNLPGRSKMDEAAPTPEERLQDIEPMGSSTESKASPTRTPIPMPTPTIANPKPISWLIPFWIGQYWSSQDHGDHSLSHPQHHISRSDGNDEDDTSEYVMVVADEEKLSTETLPGEWVDAGAIVPTQLSSHSTQPSSELGTVTSVPPGKPADTPVAPVTKPSITVSSTPHVSQCNPTKAKKRTTYGQYDDVDSRRAFEELRKVVEDASVRFSNSVPDEGTVRLSQPKSTNAACGTPTPRPLSPVSIHPPGNDTSKLDPLRTTGSRGPQDKPKAKSDGYSYTDLWNQFDCLLAPPRQDNQQIRAKLPPSCPSWREAKMTGSPWRRSMEPDVVNNAGRKVQHPSSEGSTKPLPKECDCNKVWCAVVWVEVPESDPTLTFAMKTTGGAGDKYWHLVQQDSVVSRVQKHDDSIWSRLSAQEERIGILKGCTHLSNDEQEKFKGPHDFHPPDQHCCVRHANATPTAGPHCRCMSVADRYNRSCEIWDCLMKNLDAYLSLSENWSRWSQSVPEPGAAPHSASTPGSTTQPSRPPTPPTSSTKSKVGSALDRLKVRLDSIKDATRQSQTNPLPSPVAAVATAELVGVLEKPPVEMPSEYSARRSVVPAMSRRKRPVMNQDTQVDLSVAAAMFRPFARPKSSAPPLAQPQRQPRGPTVKGSGGDSQPRWRATVA